MKIKMILHSLVIIGICTSYGYYLMFGKKGITQYTRLRKETDSEKQFVAKLEEEINELSNALHVWKHEEIAKEHMAREDLQMSYTNELIYLIPNASS